MLSRLAAALATGVLALPVASAFLPPCGSSLTLMRQAAPSLEAGQRFLSSSRPSVAVMSVKTKAGVSKGGNKAVPKDPLVIPEDYRVPAGFFFGGLGLATLGHNPGAGVPLALIGAALAARTKVVRFVFDDEAMEVLTVGQDGELELAGENFAVGGRNRWTYDSFVNWEFYPSPAFPILVYFKETQTSPEGQIHFFPCIMDGQLLYQTLKKNVPLPGK